ncbi:hypothetical protein [Flammeovirga sp. EKP202]|uniref:hypothetical protein n=1 Tax=Flammeovirga sp. EKP202 TaxID=2770592 RepID=UPI00165EEA45|nr:hypothetical protein [Flammeovirga sp. EKP202]MBD0403193.1 hypothetical protein [Flammeovirga sp. EKP202]
MKHFKVSNAILMILLTVVLSSFVEIMPIKNNDKAGNAVLSTFSICKFTFEMIAEVHRLKRCYEIKEFVIPDYNPNDIWSWWRVAETHEVNFCLLLLLNDVANANDLKAGQIILLPTNYK